MTSLALARYPVRQQWLILQVEVECGEWVFQELLLVSTGIFQQLYLQVLFPLQMALQ